MRISLCFILILFSSTRICSQNAVAYTERIDSIITDVNSYGKVKYVFRYDSAGMLSERVEYIEKNGRWIDSERRIYNYDARGKIALVSVVPPQGEDNSAHFREEYTYDEKGNLLFMAFKTKERNGGEWEKKSLREFLYNEKGFLVKRTDDEYREGERREMFMSEKKYDQKGRLTVSYEYEFRGREKTPRRMYRYSYNKKNQLSKKTEYAPDGRNFWRRTRTEWRNYDKSGRLKTVSFSKEDKLWGYRTKEEYHYDTRGNLTQIRSRIYSGGAEEYEKTISFIYAPDTPVSSVMGLNCSEVISTDWALRENLNLTSKPLSVMVEEKKQQFRPEKALYYYSSLGR